LRLKLGVTQLPDLSRLSHDEKDALIRALWAQVQALTAQVQKLTAQVAELVACEEPKNPCRPAGSLPRQVTVLARNLSLGSDFPARFDGRTLP
jgi:hypothetical protein